MTTEPSERAVTEPHELPWPSDLGMDALKWAQFFGRITRERPEIMREPLEDVMLGWFANANMAGYDEAQRRGEDRLAAVTAERDALRAEIAELKEKVELRRLYP